MSAEAVSKYRPIDPAKEEECDCDPMYAHRCHKCGGRGWVPIQEPVASPQATRHTEDCCLDLDHKGDCKRWMKLPPNSAYPNFKEIHIQDDWCPKAGCVLAGPCDITAAHGAGQPAAGTTPRLCAKCHNFSEEKDIRHNRCTNCGEMFEASAGTTPQATRERIKPDADGGCTCPCGYGFNFKVWFSGEWECPRCNRLFTIDRSTL